MSVDPQRYLLPQEEAVRRFHERIVPRHLAHGVRQERPVLVIVAGQPGAGKTAVENRVHADLGGGTVTLDADALRPVHPDYVTLALEDDRTASQATHADAVRWVEMAKEHCIENRYNVVLSTTLRTTAAARTNLEQFRRAGYRVEVVAIAVHEAASRLGVLSRYQQGREDVGFGRYVPDAFQRDAYAGLLSALDHVDREHLADAVHVFLRDGTRIYTNTLDQHGEWTRPPGTRAAVEAGRARPWTTEEITQFRDRAAELAEQLPQELRSDLLAIAEAARTHVAEPAPPRAATTAAVAFPNSTRSVLSGAGQPPARETRPQTGRAPATDRGRDEPDR